MTLPRWNRDRGRLEVASERPVALGTHQCLLRHSQPTVAWGTDKQGLPIGNRCSSPTSP